MLVLLPDGRNLTLPATHTASSAALPALSPMAAPLALLFAGDACAALAPDVPRPAIGGFVLFARRGGAALSDATAQSAALTNPCIVSCTVGRGVVDASTLSLADVLGGLPSSCPAPAEYTGRRCPTNLCAFSGHATNSSGDSSGGAGAQAPLPAPPPTLREVCCVLDSPAFEMALPNTSGAELSTAVPALYLPLALGQLLEAQCDPHARVTSADAGAAAADTAPALSACSALLYEEGEVPVGRWDSSAPLIWLLATRCDAR